MKRQPVRLQAVVWTVAAAATLAAGSAPASDPKPPSSVAEVPPESVRVFVERLVPVVESLRGQRFRAAVPVHVEDDSAAASHFAARLERFLPPSRRRAWEHAHVAFGLLPPGTDVMELLLDVLAEQCGGYYDPARDAFILLGDMPATSLSMLAVHELTHALDDQMWDIDSLLAATADDDDRAAAFACVVEGSGVEVMTSWILQALAAGELSAEALAALADSEAGRAERLRAAPDVVVRTIVAPYVAGHAFLRHVPGPSLAQQIDRAFAAPPVSTEQILHPAKYWDPDSVDVPSPVPVPDLAALLGAGFERLGRGGFGELELAALCGGPLDLGSAAGGDAFTHPAAAGWDGDVWTVWARGDSLAAVFQSRWDTEDDAREFAAAARWPAGVHVARRRAGVVAVQGVAPRDAQRIAAACFAAIEAAPRR